MDFKLRMIRAINDGDVKQALVVASDYEDNHAADVDYTEEMWISDMVSVRRPDHAHDDWTQYFGIVRITRQLIAGVCDLVRQYGCNAVSSVGFGSGYFEWFIAKSLGRKVHAVEIFEPRLDSVYEHVKGELDVDIVTTSQETADPSDNALMFVWGTSMHIMGN